ncbi:DUF7507 domain-containing protein [Microbacterium oxydans]|uniref:DUF7507 domain-containing protein n=1 Tax=Microbacterium oxydans TaxID=82380 RepID=UPI0022B1470C|nr:hypothetical protein [Microbacterium oxydans]MCZ4303015.1 hypothetical protein [Microbacterium oxydans]
MKARSRARGVAALLAAVSVVAASLIFASPAYAAGSVLLDETFGGETVPDVRAIGLDGACITGATAAPPPGASNLGPCTFTNGSPTPGLLPGWLQLNDESQNRNGGMVFDRALPANAGLEIEFDQAQYGGSGADGISFFLSDGSRSLTSTGGIGASLGYAPFVFGGTSQEGVAGGYLGVAFDAWGYNTNDDQGRGVGCPALSGYLSPPRVGNTVTLRGPGDGYEGYCFLASTRLGPPGGASTLPGEIRNAVGPDEAVRNVRVTVSPDEFPVVTVEIDFTGTRTAYQTVLSYVMDERPPATYKFGFAASTGAETDVHLIRNVQVMSVNPLGDISLVKQVDRTDPQPAAYGLGDTIPYQFVVTNTGVEQLTGVVVDDPLIADVSCPSTVLGPAGGADSSMVCTGSYTVTAADAQQTSFVNTATVVAQNSVGEQVTDESSATVDITIAHASLALTKIAVLNEGNGNGLAEPGETVTYSFAVTNTGTVTVTDPVVDDPRVGSVTCPVSIAPGETVTCTADADYTVVEADILAGGVVNTASVSATPPAGVTPPDPVEDTVTVPTPVAVAGLGLEKIAVLNEGNGNGLAEPGETVTYSFAVTNTGTVTVTDPVVDDPRVGSVTCPVSIAPGETVTCTADADYTVVEADILAGGVVNTASVSATPPAGVTPPDPVEDTVIVPTAIPDAGLSLEKIANLAEADGDGIAEIGDVISYEFLLTNVGNVTLVDVGVSDPTVGTVICDTTTLAIGESTTCVAPATHVVTEDDVLAGAVTNTATGVATPPVNVGFVPPIDTAIVPTVEASAGLSIVKDATIDDTNGNGLADIGETIAYSFVVMNTGTVTVSDITVTDPLAGSVTCPATSLAGGASMTCTADVPYTVVEADLLAGGVVNTATADGTVPDGVEPFEPPTDTVTTPTPADSAGLAITKIAQGDDADSSGLAGLGETIAYSFVVMNTGTVTVSDITVTDPLAGSVTCPATSLAGGASMTCTADVPYTVVEADLLAGGVVNTATADGTVPDGVEPVEPPTDTVTTPTDFPTAGIEMVKSATLDDANGNGLADVGETIDYRFQVRNTGNVTLAPVTIDDPMIGAVTCDSESLPPATMMECAGAPYTVTTDDIARGSVVNVATANGTPPDGVAPPPPSESTVTVATAAPPAPPAPPGGGGGGLAVTGAALGGGLTLAALLLALGAALRAADRVSRKELLMNAKSVL